MANTSTEIRTPQGGGENLDETLDIGNFTGGQHIIVSNGDRIQDTAGVSFIDPRSGGASGLTSISGDLLVDANTNRVGVGTAPTTHKFEIFAEAGQHVFKVGDETKDNYFNMNSVGRSHFYASGSTGGLSIGPSEGHAKINGAALSVTGAFSTSTNASFGNASLVTSAITAPINWYLKIDTTILRDSNFTNSTYLATRSSKFDIRDATNAYTFATIQKQVDDTTIFLLNDASSVTNLQKTSTIRMDSEYWTGATRMSTTNEIKAVSNTDGTVEQQVLIDGAVKTTVHRDGQFQLNNVFTVATALALTARNGSVIVVTDESGGHTIAVGDGTNFRRVSDGNIIS